MPTYQNINNRTLVAVTKNAGKTPAQISPAATLASCGVNKPLLPVDLNQEFKNEFMPKNLRVTVRTLDAVTTVDGVTVVVAKMLGVKKPRA
jgi:hypothetical protein